MTDKRQLNSEEEALLANRKRRGLSEKKLDELRAALAASRAN